MWIQSIRRVQRAGASNDEHRGVVEPGFVDRLARVLQADNVVNQRGLRPPRRQVIALRHGDRHLFVAAGDDLGRDISTVGHQGFMHPTGGRTGIQDDVLDAKPIQQVDDEIRHVLGLSKAHRCCLSFSDSSAMRTRRRRPVAVLSRSSRRL